MKSSDVYDAVNDIDERFIDETNALLENPARAAFEEQKIKNRRIALTVNVIAAAVLCVSVATLAVVGITALTRSKRGQIEGGPKGAGNSANSLSPGYMTVITAPKNVINNSAFSIECAFGIDTGKVQNTAGSGSVDDAGTGNVFKDCKYGVYVTNNVYTTDPLNGLRDSDSISFLYGSGKYTEMIEIEDLKTEYTFNDEGGGGSDGVDASSLPVHMSIQSKANNLDAGTKGRIFAGFYEKEKDGNSSLYNGSSVYYYCSGDVIGFGTTEEEAFENASSEVRIETELQKTVTADLDGDGSDETVEVLSAGGGYKVVIKKDGAAVWQKSLSVSHVDWNSFSLCEADGKKYVLEYNPYMNQGIASYSYVLYGYSESGSVFVEDENRVNFDVNGREYLPVSAMITFADKLNGYLENSEILVSTLNGKVSLEGRIPNEVYAWVEEYSGTVSDESLREKLNVCSNSNYVAYHKYPQFLGLNTENGLDVIVWQMAPGSYSFALLEHSSAPRDTFSLLGIRGVGLEEMKAILATYSVSSGDIYIVPWQNPISSYIPECWINRGGEDMEAKYLEYVSGIREMLGC